VVWENGAVLNVQNGFAYPNVAPGGNSQGMMLFFNGKEDGGYLEQMDSFRGVKHCFTANADKLYNETNPDYFQLVPYGGDGFKPVGYGYRSVEFIVNAMVKANEAKTLSEQQAILKRLDDDGIMATPKNSAYNELVMEAGRMSITNGGRDVMIEYGAHPKVRFKEASEYVKI